MNKLYMTFVQGVALPQSLIDFPYANGPLGKAAPNPIVYYSYRLLRTEIIPKMGFILTLG